MLTMRIAPLCLLFVACSLEVGGTKSDIPALQDQSVPDAASLGEVDAHLPGTHPCSGSEGDAGCVEVGESDAMAEAPCPSNPEKTSPGVCGCGTPDADSDDDGVIDCVDRCIGFSDNSKEQGCSCDAARQVCGNRPPTVAFLEPNTTTVDRDELSVLAEAHDDDGTIRRLTLFVDGKRIRDERQEPYCWGSDSGSPKELQRLSTGVHAFEVEAEDDRGATARVQKELTILP